MAPAPSISKENLPLRLCRIDLFLKRNNQAVQGLEIFHFRWWRIQRHDDLFDDFGGEPCPGSFQARHPPFSALHLRQHLLEHSGLSNLLRAPGLCHSLQQTAIQAFANLLLHRLNLSDKALAIAIDSVPCEVTVAAVPVGTSQHVAVSSRLRPEPRKPSL